MPGEFDGAKWSARAVGENAARLRELARERGLAGVEGDIVARAAFERLLQRVSDASRGVPEEWKTRRADIGWQEVADLGDMIATDYDRLDHRYLWDVYEAQIEPMAAALEEMVADYARGKEA
jgi:uncharacterized protein with HEPN domain